jgi:copper homeostasis protein
MLAEQYKADAIELCIDLEFGGLTPSIAMIQKARNIFTKELAVFFRPRNGDFCFDQAEKEIILKDIQIALECGIDAIVAGGLNSTGDLDIDFMKELIDTSMGNTLVFHRAIDVSKNPIEILEQLVNLQIDRVLTSGCTSNALNGAKNLSDWNKQFGDKIQIMAAGGIDHLNAKEILDKSGLRRFHASLRKNIQSINSVMNLGSCEKADEDKLKKLMQVFGR